MLPAMPEIAIEPLESAVRQRAYDLVVFDLDGTLSDPLQGIGRSINYALSHFGYEELDISQLGQYIGPPIDTSFEALTGSTQKSVIEALVTRYRERYSDLGFSENV